MALTPVFPMLLQQMVTYLTGREFEKSQLVGGSLSLSYPFKPDANDGVFESPSGNIFTVPVRGHGDQYVAFLDHASEAGFYTARVSVQSPGQPIAVNVDTQESDVRCLSIEYAQQAFGSADVIVAESTQAYTDDIRRAHEYWRFLLAGCLLFLVLESVIASGILKRQKNAYAAAQPSAEGGEVSV